VKKIWTCFTLSAALLSNAQAQTAPQPVPVVNESWTYQTTDQWTSKVLSKSQLTLVGIDGEFGRMEYEYQAANPKEDGFFLQPQKSARTVRLSLNYANTINGKVYPVEDYRWPLTVGQKWSTTYKYSDSNASYRIYTYNVDHEVVGWETVETPAGSFKALKIVRKRKSILDSDGTLASAVSTAWYAPEAKRLVKFNFENFDATGAPYTRTTEVLIKHTQ
jgi:hypothetical protein